MSFPIAVQSAIFYFIACTPCRKARHRHKAKENARKEREEKAKLETEQPGLYRHPSPFNTNPFWQEEIARGPSLPKKCNSKNSSQRRLSSSGRADSAISVPNSNTEDATRANVDTFPTVIEGQPVTDDWNRQHGYQREDEELWGQWSGGQKWKDAFSKARDSAGRLIESTLGLEKEITEEERHNFYTTPKNPPVNDYHPPVVSSRPEHKDAHKWMLQPPPSAKVMEGKIPVSRAVSAASLPSRSATSRSTPTIVEDNASLPRSSLGKDKENARPSQTQDRADRVSPSEQELIDSLFVTRSRSFPRSRSLSLDDSDGSIERALKQRKSRPRPRPRAVPTCIESSDEEDDPTPTNAPKTDAARSLALPKHVMQRPGLPTILSADSVDTRLKSSRGSKRSRRSSRRRALSGTASPVGDDTD